MCVGPVHENPRAVVGTALRELLHTGRLDLPLPGGGATRARWSALASWGRRDLVLARLVEAHTDAVAILAEAGRSPAPGALYGVWAARSGGARAGLTREGRAWRLDGTVRFCSGAEIVDRALVVADRPAGGSGAGSKGAGSKGAGGSGAGEGTVLVDVAVVPPGARPEPGTWQTCAMAGANTLDVNFTALPVGAEDVLGPAGWYTARPGFLVGGAGVAAVWWGGAAGLLERALTHLPAAPDAHRLAHVGELDAFLAAADALLTCTAQAVDAAPGETHAVATARVRTAVERAAREVVDRVPRIVGPGPLSQDPFLARTLADLGLYVRQHHGERDHAALGTLVLGTPALGDPALRDPAPSNPVHGNPVPSNPVHGNPVHGNPVLGARG
ncbi:MAG: acyl-CoA dehydrogenase [Pseudonocardia sp.]|nr:acyl-CoA dehydrogenase [Pseudonocardia sp.]